MNKGLDALKETAIQIVEAIYGKEEPVRTNKINELLETIQFKCLEKELKDYKRLIEIINKYIELDNNYNEMGSGSTKALKICIPNCISIEEDDDYIDDCYPNSDYDFINNLLKEVLL